ncbi:MAG: biopolymer transporter ExbD [Gemmatimonadetes bacterium]|nr:biopolymer transporter ExbD [Gemmatimonadota bacterium]NNK63410.1 biopolymer transporter ExbD [Gemmatimonadota bacterium]
MARRRGNRGDLPMTADINVTSLVDVAFTLLVVFIIIAPALQGGIEIQIPEADVAPITSVDDPLIVTLNAEGRVWVEDVPMDIEEFQSAFAGLLAAAPREVVYLKSDANARVEDLYQVMGIINAAGIAPSLVAEEWAN